MILSGDLGDLSTEPVNSTISANTYKANFKEREVAVRVLKTCSKQSSEETHKVKYAGMHTILAYPPVFLAAGQGGGYLGTAQARKHPAVRWGFYTAIPVLYSLHMDAPWRRHEFHRTKPQS